MEARGTLAFLKVGYQTAAELTDWSVEKDKGEASARVHARVQTVQPYWLAKTPLMLRIECARSTWIWPEIPPPIGVEPGKLMGVVVPWPPPDIRDK